MNLSKEHSHISAKRVAERIAANQPVIAMDSADVANYGALAKVGVGFAPSYLQKAGSVWAMDDVNGGNFAPSALTPVQFLQGWLPGFVRAEFAPRKIDELVGITTVGNWHDEEVVQGVLETMGEAVPYGDHTNIPYASFNAGFERRHVVRFEKGIKVGRLEEGRAGAMRLDAAAEKRTSAALALDIARNSVGFNGFNKGDNRTYGILNDPALPAYQSVAAGKSGQTTWAGKTFLEITADIRAAFSALQGQSQGVIDAEQTPTILALPNSAVVYLSVTSDYGNSVREWIAKTFPKCRIVSVPNFDKANGGANVFYLFAEEVADGSSDDKRVFVQAVPAKFMALGVDNNAKATIEDYTNATAGVICKRPYAVYRGTGI